MSSWFKFSDQDLASRQFQYCLKKQPASIIVYLWCLSECSHKRKDSFPWTNNAIDIDGVASGIHMEFEQVKSALGLLCDAKLIEISKKELRVINWNEHQSEYLSRKEYFADRYAEGTSVNFTVKNCASPLSTVNNSKALLEEKRLDQSTEQKRKRESVLDEPEDHRPVFVSPTMKDECPTTNA